MERKASVVWNGEIKSGNGTVSTESGVLEETPYSFKTRFEGERGTNPEELIAAAHASCFSMAFANELGQAGMKPETIETDATVHMEKTEAGTWTIARIHLETRPTVPNADEESVRTAADSAKANCPISRLLNAEITMDLSFTAAGPAPSREAAELPGDEAAP